jgi:hypothetical protein
MITLLADSKALRHPGLKAYLQASRDHAIALSDLRSSALPMTG